MIAASTSYPTPPQLAKRYGVDPNKILGLIESGELVAINLATRGASRPRWRISPDAIAAFEAVRSSRPQPKVSRIRRKKDPSVIEFF